MTAHPEARLPQTRSAVSDEPAAAWPPQTVHFSIRDIYQVSADSGLLSCCSSATRRGWSETCSELKSRRELEKRKFPVIAESPGGLQLGSSSTGLHELLPIDLSL